MWLLLMVFLMFIYFYATYLVVKRSMFLPFNKIKSLKDLGGSSCVDRKGKNIFSGT